MQARVSRKKQDPAKPRLEVVADTPKRRNDVSLEIEIEGGRRVLGGILVDSGQLPAVHEIGIRGSSLYHPRDRIIFEACERLCEEGLEVTLLAVMAELNRRGLAGAITSHEVAELFDEVATGATVQSDARQLLKLSREREWREHCRRGAEGEDVWQRLVEIHDELAGAGIETARKSLADIGFTGDRLEAVRNRPQRESPLPGLLPPDPALGVKQGRPKIGKSTKGEHTALCWSQGIAPWKAAPRLPGTRALIISAEQSVSQIDRTLRRLSNFHPESICDHWTKRITIVARDPDLDREGRRMLTLDDGGRATFRSVLLRAQDAGDPFGFVLLDSLSRLKPAELDENSADDMTRFCDPLQELAEELGVYILLVHHRGHSSDPARAGAIGASRGSSAIGAVAQFAWTLDAVPGEPRQRVLRVSGNDLLEAEHHFQVAGDQAEPGAIHFFRLVDPLAEYAARLEDLIGAGEEISSTELAWRLAGKRPSRSGDRPPGRFAKTAAALRDRWEREGLIAVTGGGPGKTIHLRRADR